MPMTPCTRMFRATRAAAFGALLFGTSLVLPAHAMPNFPSEIQTHLGLSYAPPCIICHATAQGGGPITTKFGQAMLSNGLTTSTASLAPALDALNAAKTDSDGDGTPDIQQIEEGRDPSTGASGPVERYGCGARMATAPVKSFSLVLCTAALIACAIGRRRVQFGCGGSPKDRTNNS